MINYNYPYGQRKYLVRCFPNDSITTKIIRRFLTVLIKSFYRKSLGLPETSHLVKKVCDQTVNVFEVTFANFPL